MIITAGINGKIYFWNSVLELIKSFNFSDILGRELEPNESINSIDLFKCSRVAKGIKQKDNF